MQPWAEYQNNLNIFRAWDKETRVNSTNYYRTTGKMRKMRLFICCTVQENAVLSGLPYFLMWTGTIKLPTDLKYNSKEAEK
jgi:hypothetical protein